MSQTTAIDEAWARVQTLDSQMEHERAKQEDLRRKLAASREKETDLFGIRSEWVQLLSDAGVDTFEPHSASDEDGAA